MPGVDEEPRRVAKHGLPSLSEAAIEWLHDHRESLQVFLGYKVMASDLLGISHAFTSLTSAEADGSSKAEKRKSQDMGPGMEETERQRPRATPANASVSRMQSKMDAVGIDVVMVPKDVGATTPEPKRARRHSRQTIEKSTVLEPPLADKDAFKVQCAEWLRTANVRTVFVKTSYEDHKWTRVGELSRAVAVGVLPWCPGSLRKHLHRHSQRRACPLGGVCASPKMVARSTP